MNVQLGTRRPDKGQKYFTVLKRQCQNDKIYEREVFLLSEELNIDTFFKVIAYACLYKSKGTSVNKIRANDITITFVRQRKPFKLFNQLASDGFSITSGISGIYLININFFFDIQIIVTRELNEDHHIWLSSLTQDISKTRAEKLINTAASLYLKDDKDFAESVLQVTMSKNKGVFDKVKEESEMCEALRELMKPEIDAEVKRQVQEQVQKQVQEQVQKQVQEQVQKQVQERMDAFYAENRSAIAEKNSAIAEKDREIELLKAKLAAAGIC